MFQHSTYQLGKYLIDKFHDDQGNSISIVPSRGATILQIEVLGTPILDGYTTAAELSTYDWYKNAVLLPYPNRLRDGLFSFEDIEYQWPINESANNNQLHGFGFDSAFKLSCFDNLAGKFTCTYQFDYQGNRLYFPFHFLFEMRIEMTQNGSVTIQMNVQNTSTKYIPFACGWHPYFKIADSVDQVVICSPQLSQISVDKRMLPTNEVTSFDAFTKPKSLKSITLDNCFRAMTGAPRLAIELSSEQGQLSYWQDTQCPYVQIFTPSHRQSIAIEPMTSNIDALNNEEGLWRLAPNEQRAMSFGLTFEHKKSLVK